MELKPEIKAAIVAALNLDENRVKTLNEADDSAKAVQEFFNDRRQSQNKKFLELKLNDNEFKKPFLDDGYNKATAQWYGSFETASKALGIEIKRTTLEGERRSVKDMITEFKTKIEESVGSPKEATVKLQEQLADALKAKEQLESSFSEQLKVKEADYNAKINGFLIKESVKNVFANIEGLKFTPDEATTLFLSSPDDFPLSLTEGNISFQKPDGTFPVVENTVIKDASKYIQHKAKTKGWIIEEEPKKPPVPKKIEGRQDGGTQEKRLPTRMERVREKVLADTVARQK